MITSITVTNDAAKRIEGGGLWFAKGDVVGRTPKIAGVAGIMDKRKRHLGMAFLSPESRYYLRVFSRVREVVDKKFWRERIARALAKRAPLKKITNAYRIVFSESDEIPSVVIDRYDDVYAIQITSVGAEAIKKDLIEILAEDFSPACIIEKNDSAMRREEGLSAADVVVFGSKTRAVVREAGKVFELDVLRGQKTGAYLDYRAFRLKAREFARGVCLDAFCYEGWFACQIADATKSVTAVDSSAGALRAAEANAKRNGCGNIELVKVDVFDFLKEGGKKFDFMHLDPPSFAKGRGGLAAAIAGYRRMLKDALKLLKIGGVMLVSSCSHAVSAGALEKTVLNCFGEAGRKGEVVYRGIQDIDHPVLRGHPESLYLKAVAVKAE